MNSSQSKMQHRPSRFEVIETDKYLTTLKGVLKSHYRNDRKGAELLRVLLDEFRRDFEEFGEVGGKTAPEPVKLPHSYFKVRFNMPSLQGASRLGRIIYAKQASRVILVIIYTHKEYEKRPPVDLLKI